MRLFAAVAMAATLFVAGCGPTYCGSDPCCGDPCCGDPCCGDPCCGDPCCGDPCCGDPCCGQCAKPGRFQTDAGSAPQPAAESRVDERAPISGADSTGLGR